MSPMAVVDVVGRPNVPKVPNREGIVGTWSHVKELTKKLCQNDFLKISCDKLTEETRHFR